MDRQSLPRFIQTQSGAYVNLASVEVLHIEQLTKVCTVVAVLSQQWEYTLGDYNTENDAIVALNSLISQTLNTEQTLVYTPRRDFRTAEAGE